MMTSFALLAAIAAAPAPASAPFAVTVVDEATGRGVPLVELRTVNEIRYVTDSQGVAAVDEPGLMGLDVFFHVKSHGYEYPRDRFGYRGKALKVTQGGSATLKVKRLNVAERLYRTIGGGIDRDSVLVGRPVPIKHPLLNAKVIGSDSVLMAPYRGKLIWFWGDTSRPGYPLGNFDTPGATSEPPGKGGLDPEIGVDYTYFVDDKTGFARPTAKLPGSGPTWLGGLASFVGESGQEQLVAGYAKIRPPLETYEHGLAVFDPGKDAFDRAATFPLKSPVRPGGHTIKLKDGGDDFIHYTTPFPLVRVRARLDDLKDVSRYEAFTCLERGSRLDRPKFDRGPDGRLRYSWRADTPAVGPAEQARFVREGKIKEDEALLPLRDVETGKAVMMHGGTVYWNAYRGRWVMVAVEGGGGPSFLGEVWFAEADGPLGPWAYARKVVTHDKYSFYNPKQHPELDKDGGRVIFFEGTYTVSFSGNTDPTPRYDYNQVMYKLDLSDPRLNLPVPVYALPDGGGYATGPAGLGAAGGAAPAFFALARPGTGTVAVNVNGAAGKAVFHALAADAKGPPKTTVPLSKEGERYSTGGPSGRAVGLVWTAPTRVRIPVTP
jgi:hypothetical protein